MHQTNLHVTQVNQLYPPLKKKKHSPIEEEKKLHIYTPRNPHFTLALPKPSPTVILQPNKRTSFFSNTDSESLRESVCVLEQRAQQMQLCLNSNSCHPASQKSASPQARELCRTPVSQLLATWLASHSAVWLTNHSASPGRCLKTKGATSLASVLISEYKR